MFSAKFNFLNKKVTVSVATFNTFNSTWTAIGFTGSGTSASPYTRTGYVSNMVPAQAKVVSAGTVRITGSMHSDFGVNIYKNNISTIAYTIADQYGGNGGNYTLNATITVAANDIIIFGDASFGDYFDLRGGQTINIWYQ